MSQLYDRLNKILLEINLVFNDNIDIENHRDDYENWIPFEFKLKLENEEEYILTKNGCETFNIQELKYMISGFESIINSKKEKKLVEEFSFESIERHFSIKVYDTYEEDSFNIDLWLIISKFNNLETYGYEKGFKYVVLLDSFIKFVLGLKEELQKILNATVAK